MKRLALIALVAAAFAMNMQAVNNASWDKNKKKAVVENAQQIQPVQQNNAAVPQVNAQPMQQNKAAKPATTNGKMNKNNNRWNQHNTGAPTEQNANATINNMQMQTAPVQNGQVNNMKMSTDNVATGVQNNNTPKANKRTVPTTPVQNTMNNKKADTKKIDNK
ncbi:MAG: hypothetical protein J6Y84_00255 [Bacteroidaceae bacterium]|nr:hypothetical protein [Bacteroidaceae bacterium]